MDLFSKLKDSLSSFVSNTREFTSSMLDGTTKGNSIGSLIGVVVGVGVGLATGGLLPAIALGVGLGAAFGIAGGAILGSINGAAKHHANQPRISIPDGGKDYSVMEPQTVQERAVAPEAPAKAEPKQAAPKFAENVAREQPSISPDKFTPAANYKDMAAQREESELSLGRG